jgi:hypothetical protein
MKAQHIDMNKAIRLASYLKTPKQVYKYCKHQRIHLGWYQYILSQMDDKYKLVSDVSLWENM